MFFLSASHLFVFALVSVNLMGGVRYVFRLGEPETSPTYSELPSEYFLFWDVMVGLMALIVLLKTRKLSLNAVVSYGALLAIALGVLLQAESFHVRGAARSIILYGFLFLCIYSNSHWLNERHLARALELLTIIGVSFLVYQYVQYVSHGVLPAHSHEGQLIRYGSFYDDSLVLGMLLPMFVGYFLQKFATIHARILTSAIATSVAVLTGSLTAMAVTAVYIVWSSRRHWYLLVTLATVYIYSYFQFLEQLTELWWFKAESIEGHLEGWQKIENVGLLTLTGLAPLDTFAESGFLLLLYNFGILVVAIVLVFHVLTLLACHRILRSTNVFEVDTRAMAGATEGLIISVLLGSMNLPIVIIAPVYLFVAILSAIAMRRRVGRAWRSLPVPSLV